MFLTRNQGVRETFPEPYCSNNSHSTYRQTSFNFKSKLHKTSLETEMLLQKPSVFEMLKKHCVDEEVKSKVLNRRVLKTMLTVILYMVKHRLPNDSFSDLLRLVADCGSEDIKKHLIDTPKNAMYMSPKSFAEILATMNEYVENPIFFIPATQAII